MSLKLKTLRGIIFTRHSFLFKTHVPGLSDIDFTILFDEPLPLAAVQSVLNKYDRVKKIFPILGEINIFTKKNCNDFIEFANYFEITRDPVFIKKIKFDLKRLSQDEYVKAVNLFRALEADSKNLKNYSLWRQKKWQTHLQSNISPLSIENILKDILTRIHLNNEYVYNSLLEYFQKVGSGINHMQIPIDEVRLSFMPHRYSYLYSDQKIDKRFYEISKYQIYWEIWGLYSQVYMLSSTEDGRGILRHLLNLENFVQKAVCFDDNEAKKILTGLSKLKAYYKQTMQL